MLIPGPTTLKPESLPGCLVGLLLQPSTVPWTPQPNQPSFTTWSKRNSAHQFEVRGRGEMPLAFSQSSVQINLRSAPRQPLTHRVNGNLKVPLLNTSISSLNKLRRLQQKTEEKLAVCKLIKPCSSSNPSGISYHLPISHFHLNTILFGLSKELLSDSTHLPAILSYVVELF